MLLRLLPWLAMVGGVVAWFALGQRILRESVTPLLLAGALLSSPSIRRYAAELKQYSFDVLCVAVGLHALCTLTRGPPTTGRRTALAALALTRAVATNHLAWLPCAALWLASWLREDRIDRTAFTCLAVGGGCCS